MTARTKKEGIYDGQISPLMSQILTICKKHKINMLADFSLGYDPKEDQTLFCTSFLGNIDPEDIKGVERISAGYAALRPKRQLLALTIHKGKKE